MSNDRPSKVFLFDNNDPAMKRACEDARANFRYFWREVAWERRRIVPALDLACVKAPFSDGGDGRRGKDGPEVEQMWMDEIDFDGDRVSGRLLNAPNWLRTFKKGDAAEFPLGEISDWMYAINGTVFGAYTVNLLRSRMGTRERREHDDAWGLDFGDPARIRVAPEPKRGSGLLKGWFGKQPADTGEHPMSLAMASSLRADLAKDPSIMTTPDDRGWTFLHHEALAGNAATVKVLLEAGADPNTLTDNGQSARQLAESLGWGNVAALLAVRSN